jgi:CRP-like cAMP-binding protein
LLFFFGTLSASMAVKFMKEFAYIHEEGQLPVHLKAVPFLNTFTDEQLDEVLNSSSLIEADDGDVIIREGSIDSRIYVLLNGLLDVRIGGKKVASITRPGEVFGELAIVNQDKRLASVLAAGRAVCLAVDQKFLQDIHPREEDPAFHAALYEFVARVIARKLDFTSRRLAEVEKELRELKSSSSPASEVVKIKTPRSRPAKRPVVKAKRVARR